ncbi:p-loop containing nucleoside triphosphate hydrolase [Venturia nashicola]|uniref:p-loop containing nucleoside triphosphate hydrolase n=1 Tax=Venturia nashicola TaxID=86259 RepID=A0A4Z1P836_9PEZI|nr:p-loop containing nucleoside triphosphate hydrolase [Venturia nashicola]
MASKHGNKTHFVPTMHTMGWPQSWLHLPTSKRIPHYTTRAASPQSQAENVDDDPVPTFNNQFESADITRLLERIAQQQQKDLENSWRGSAGIAGQYAANLSLPQSQAHAKELASWFFIHQEDGHLPIKNVAYYSQLSQYPRAAFYPELPAGLFQTPPDSHAMASLYIHLEKYGKVNYEEKLVKRPTQYTWRHDIKVSLGGKTIDAQGEDATKHGARIGASMDVIYQLHETEKLEALIGLDWTPTEKVSKTTDPGKKINRASKLQVYNYAARFGQIPIFHMRKVENSDRTVATVTIPYVGVAGSATGASAEEAEGLACMALKEEAEKRQQNISNHPALSLRDSNTVNLDNAEDFLAYYESVRTDGELFWLEDKVSPAGAQHSCQIFWHQEDMPSKPLAEAVVMRKAPDAKRAASLVAAVMLVREHHALFDDFKQAVKANNGVTPRRISSTSITLQSNVLDLLDRSLNFPDVEDFIRDRVDPFPVFDPDAASKQVNQLTRTIKMRTFQHGVYQSHEQRSEELKTRQDYRISDTRLAEIELQRSQLPVNQRRAEILNLIKKNSQCVIVGSAGSGKSTQIPQIILDDAIADGRGAFCNVVCTQPRRVAAVSLAARVCNERGEEPGDVVGYRISGEGKESLFGGSITFTTAEMLVLQLEKATDEVLDNISHIIVDEVHERGNPTDRLLMIIKLVFSDRMKRGLTVPKLIMMSATIQASLFEQYFEMRNPNGDSIRPPVMNIPARQFSITSKYLEDIVAEQKVIVEPEVIIRPEDRAQSKGVTTVSKLASSILTQSEPTSTPSTAQLINWESKYEMEVERNEWLQQQLLVATTLAHVARNTDSGSILVFLPGWAELQHMQKLLTENSFFLGVEFSNQERYEIILLHSAYPDSLVAALAETPPGIRRIILSTNLAETSLTFADVKYVVDSGRHRLLEYSKELPANTLYRKWISRSNAAQRAGRVGRVQPGEYYGVYSSERLASMDTYSKPAALDAGTLQLLCLRARTHFPKLPIQNFFSRWLSPPPEKYIIAALDHLKAIGGLSPDLRVTAIGQTLCYMNVDPSVGKMILLGVLFRCLDPVMNSAAVMTMRMSPWGVPEDIAGQGRVAQLRKAYAMGTNSDVISTMNAYQDFCTIRNEDSELEAARWAEERYMLKPRLESFDLISTKLESQLRRLSIFDKYDREGFNQRSNNQGLVKALISTGLYPNVAVHDEGYRFVVQGGVPVTLSGQSVLRPGHGPGKTWETNPLKGSLCSYMSLHSNFEHDNSIIIAGASPVLPLASAVFCISLKVKEDDESILIMNGWIPLRFTEGPDVAKRFLEFKLTWDKLLFKALTILCQSSVGGYHYGNEERKRLRVTNLVTQTLADLFEQEERAWKKTSGWS